LPRRASLASGRVVQCVGESRYFDDAAARLVLGASKCSLAAAVKHYLKVDLDKGLQASDWSAPSLTEDQLRYAARDVIWLWRLCPPLFKDLAPQASAYKVQVAAAPAIAKMTTIGIAIDLDAHADTLRTLAEQDAIACAGFSVACIEMGKPDLALKVPRSPREIADFLTAVLTEAELAKWKRGKTAWELSTARPELRRAVHYPPIVPLIELSELDGLRLSFGEPLRFLASPVTNTPDIKSAAHRQADRARRDQISRARHATREFAACSEPPTATCPSRPITIVWSCAPPATFSTICNWPLSSSAATIRIG
jgi:hypothetical protein